jgi:anaerobic carbon-monoxide dehydrogenase iron sulfur subunit
MTLSVLAVYPQRCTGCRICEQFCSLKHHGAVNPAKSRITIHRIHEKLMSVPVACSQCVKAPCISVCPEQAITRHAETGGLVLDEDKCIGCRLCLESCIRGCIKMNGDTGMPLLCDLCDGEPQCAAHCPENAIMFLPLDQLDSGYREIHAVGIAWGREPR